MEGEPHSEPERVTLRRQYNELINSLVSDYQHESLTELRVREATAVDRIDRLSRELEEEQAGLIAVREAIARQPGEEPWS